MKKKQEVNDQINKSFPLTTKSHFFNTIKRKESQIEPVPDQQLRVFKTVTQLTSVFLLSEQMTGGGISCKSDTQLEKNLPSAHAQLVSEQEPRHSALSSHRRWTTQQLSACRRETI